MLWMCEGAQHPSMMWLLILILISIARAQQTLLYQIGPVAADFGNRSSVNAMCAAAGAGYPCSIYWAMVVYAGESIYEAPLPLTDEVTVASSGVSLATGWNAQLASVAYSTYFPNSRWMGMTDVGSAYPRATCSDWTITTPCAKAAVGKDDLFWYVASCTGTRNILCACNGGSFRPSKAPTMRPSRTPTFSTPTKSPTTSLPSVAPSTPQPSKNPTTPQPSFSPTHLPSKTPTKPPTTTSPTLAPSKTPTLPTGVPTRAPTVFTSGIDVFIVIRGQTVPNPYLVIPGEPEPCAVTLNENPAYCTDGAFGLSCQTETTLIPHIWVNLGPVPSWSRITLNRAGAGTTYCKENAVLLREGNPFTGTVRYLGYYAVILHAQNTFYR